MTDTAPTPTPTNSNTAAHVQHETVTEDIFYPEHGPRTDENPEFNKARDHLITTLGIGCHICGSKENLEAHHYGTEFAEEPNCDMDKLKAFLLEWDVHGRSAILKDTPIKDSADIRNLMILCATHHRHKDKGIHALTYPIWIMQKVAKDGVQITA